MKWVKATKTGFYGKRRERHEKFVVPDDFDVEGSSWIVDADAPLTPDEEDAKEPGLLDGTIDQILDKIGDLSDSDLVALRDAEQAGKTRKGLIAKLDDEIANRADKKLAQQTQDDNQAAQEARLLDQQLDGLTTHADVDKVAADEEIVFGPQISTVADKKQAIKDARAQKALLS